MNIWWTQFSAYLQTQLAPWMPGVDAAFAAFNAWLAQMPSVVWIGAGLWLAMRVADCVQSWGGLRSTAYGACGLAVAWAVWLMRDAGSLQAMAELAQGLFDVALGWVLFSVGQRMDMHWLLRNKALAATAVLEFSLTAFLISGVLIMLGLAWPAATVAGILAAHSSPVVLASFMPDWQADGQISARALHLGGINTLLAALCLPLLLVMVQAWQQSAAQTANAAASLWPSLPVLQRSGWDLAQPFFLLILSLAVGALLGRMLARHGRSSLPQVRQANALHVGSESMGLVAAACVCAGLAQWWGAPAWAACLALGLGLRSPSGTAWREGQSLQITLTAVSQLLLFGLSAFTLVALWMQGMLRITSPDVAISMMIPIVALMMLLRLLGKLLVCTLTARWAGLRWQQGFALGIAMQPLSMTGLALLLLAWPMLMQSDALLACSSVVALLLSDWLSPLLLRTLLQRSGEVTREEIIGLNCRSSMLPMRVDTSLIAAQSAPTNASSTFAPLAVPLALMARMQLHRI